MAGPDRMRSGGPPGPPRGFDAADNYPTEVYPQSGRLPKNVYIRRRLTVLAGLIAVIVVIVIIVVGPGRGSGADDKGAITGEGKADTSEEADAGGAEEPDAESDADADAAPKPITACGPGALAVEAVTDASDYAAGEFPKLSLRVTNHDEVACDADLGTETMLFEIKSGSELYWNSRDCQTNAAKNLVRMQPGQTLETDPIEWDRTRSNPETCDATRDEVPGGGASYHLSVEIAGERSANTKQFLLY